MFRPALALIAASSLALPAVAQGAEIQIQVTNPVVELSVQEVVRSTPDVAQVGAGVTTRAQTAQEAVRRNAAQMDQLIEKLRALGIAKKDIQTSNFNLNAQYQYRNDGQQPLFVGYDVTNQVNVKLRDLKRAGEVLDALVGAGANNIYGPNFMLENDMEAKALARKNAFQRGRLQAEEFARMAGYSGVRLLEVSETFQSYGPMPVSDGAIQVTASRVEAKTPIEPGEVGTAVTLGVKYEMVN